MLIRQPTLPLFSVPCFGRSLFTSSFATIGRTWAAAKEKKCKVIIFTTRNNKGLSRWLVTLWTGERRNRVAIRPFLKMFTRYEMIWLFGHFLAFLNMLKKTVPFESLFWKSLSKFKATIFYVNLKNVSVIKTNFFQTFCLYLAFLIL